MRHLAGILVLWTCLGGLRLEAVPRKANICAAIIAELSKAKFFQADDQPRSAVTLLRHLRMNLLEQTDVYPRQNRPITISNDSFELAFKKKSLAERIRMIESQFYGELEISQIHPFIIRGAKAIGEWVNSIRSHAESLNEYHPGLTFMHYFYWALSASSIVNTPSTLLHPSNPMWKAQVILAPVTYYLTMTDAFLNRIIGDGHIVNLKLSSLARYSQLHPHPESWLFTSFETRLPKPLFSNTWASGKVDPNAMGLQFALDDLGALRRLLYGRQIKPSWVGVDCLLVPNDQGSDWDLVIVLRAHDSRPTAPRRAAAKAHRSMKVVPAFQMQPVRD